MSCLTALVDGGWASGGDDGAVAWIGADNRVHCKTIHTDKVFCLSALGDGGWASGGDDGVVACALIAASFAENWTLLPYFAL